ncbi:MAG: methyltransferase domain-containing protein [Myxococcota bacterium]
MTTEPDYLLGVSDRELARLGFQHEAWARPTHALFDRAGFAPGHRIADLGAGPGLASVSLARRVGGDGRVFALDSSPKAIATLRRRAEALGLPQIESEVVDLAEWKPTGQSLDGVFARWLFCFLENPEGLVHRIADGLRPGGSVAILDYFNYAGFALAPPSSVMSQVVAAVRQSWASGGGSLDVAGSLPGWMAAAGLEVSDIRPEVHCGRPGTALWNWPKSFFETFLSELVGQSLLSEADAETFRNDWRSRETEPGAYVLTPPVMAIVGRKPVTDRSR